MCLFSPQSEDIQLSTYYFFAFNLSPTSSCSHSWFWSKFWLFMSQFQNRSLKAKSQYNCYPHHQAWFFCFSLSSWPPSYQSVGRVVLFSFLSPSPLGPCNNRQSTPCPDTLHPVLVTNGRQSQFSLSQPASLQILKRSIQYKGTEMKKKASEHVTRGKHRPMEDCFSYLHAGCGLCLNCAKIYFLI